MAAMVRSFIALPLPPPALKAIDRLQQQLQQQLAGVRWAPPQNLHLTLRFLGDLPEDYLEKLADIVLSVGGSTRCFQLTICEIGAFPSWHRGRVIWLGCQQPAPVVSLHRQLSAALLSLGIAEEPRPFRPHLTLGRLRHPRALPSLPEAITAAEVVSFNVDRMVLYRSQLTPRGARHTELCVAELQR